MLLQFALSSNLFGSPTGLDMLFLVVFKFLLVAGIFLYVVFAGLILRQIQLMSDTLQTSFTPFLWLFGLIHFALGLLVLFYFLVL